MYLFLTIGNAVLLNAK